MGRLIASSLKVEGGYRVNYLEGGERRGRQVVFVHGTPGSARGWVDYLLQVPAGFHHLAIDRPGFGASGPKEAVVSLGEQAEAVAAVVRAQNAGPAILVGHSYGAPVAVQCAADAPDAVGALVLLAGSLDPAQERVPLVQHIGDMWPIATTLPRALLNANRELIALKLELEWLALKLSCVRVPVVVVHGTADKLVPFANVAYIEERLTGAASLDVVALERQDHFLPWNAKTRVDEAIAMAWARCESIC
jgi:pimeloyl-ACP methyl ester carboxylesterase